ncbi:MAG TPA: hypothetical protein VF677_10595 [Flavobacterium sp.]|jgi:hypothetical protein
MADSVLNSSSVLRLSSCAKLNICASISATSPSYKPLATILMHDNNNKIHLRGTTDISLLEEKSKYSMRSIIPLRHINIIDREIFFNRVYENLQKGRNELQTMLDEVRKVTFTKIDLMNWFYKIKDDAVNEVEHIFIKFEATFGGEIKDINFERIGFLSGIFEEADKMLSIMIAIEPLDENKPHYSILDILEKVDNQFKDENIIPGYYNIQEHPKIKIRKYQLKNLDNDWAEYIEKYKNSEYISDDFGNINTLIGWYHTNFAWDIYKTKPREEIKSFLDFHYKSFSLDKNIFLLHIGFRVLQNIENFARTDHKIYSQLINEWIKGKREKLSEAEKLYIVESVKSVCLTFLDNVYEYGKSKNENRYNILLRDFLKQRISSKKWSIKDQSMGGTTLSKDEENKGISFRDLIITDENSEHLSAIECFRIKSVPKKTDSDSVISEHLIKIFKNEPIGLNPLFIIVYCESANYEKTWEKYTQYISQIDFGKYQQLQIDKLEESQFTRANLKMIKVNHYRSTSEISVYHLFINMNP